MLILSDVSDENGGGDEREGAERDLNAEYQTASELFELMTKNSDFDANDVDSLTTRDLVLLYKNIDIGTKLMNDATEMKLKKPNQYVETIVYNDGLESDSELSEIYSTDDVHNVFMVNQERLDFLNNKSLDNLLGHKFGGIEIKSSNLSTAYDKNFLFNDPYIKNQLLNLNPMASCSEFDNLFSTSLIDYICCKRLEDNYNFYMDNIIRYVQHTIEQLKRISNGDYLTDRAKEKWREVNSNEQEKNTKVLATSTSIPLHVQCKSNGNVTWDDIVHSEVDVRSLSKILEKKIVIEIPKLICGSYRLYSKRYADNLVISCQKEQQKIEKESQESRLDVVLQLQRSQTGQVVSNISSVMILRTAPALQDLHQKEILALPYKEGTDYIDSSKGEEDAINPTGTVTELGTMDTDMFLAELDTETALEETKEDLIKEYRASKNEGSLISNEYPCSECDQNDYVGSIQHSSETSFVHEDVIDNTMYPPRHEPPYNMISPDELRMTMRRLKMQKSVLDESCEDSLSPNTSKRRSPIRVRIKSPYENKSFLLEEKKRKRLLEIRERREKKKIALSENCKISKHKYGKGAIMPQASSSVTKLSITNKSFYNSIYGESANVENKLPKLGRPARKGQKTSTTPTTEVSLIEDIQEDFESPMLTPESNSNKYVNRSYYLDDAVTAIMCTQMKINENEDEQIISESNSIVSNEFNGNIKLFSKFISPPCNTKLNSESTALSDDQLPSSTKVFCRGEESSMDALNSVNAVPINTVNSTQLSSKKSLSSDECRKSIDQLYDLIKNFSKQTVSPELGISKNKVGAIVDSCDGVEDISTIQGSDSGTSVKHHDNVTMSNHTGFSTDKNNTISTPTNNPVAAVPKVIISSKLQVPKVEANKMKKDHRRVTINPPSYGIPENPLKAISHLLQEFDNVQKTRQKPTTEVRQPKKAEVVLNDGKTISRQGSYRRRSRLEQHLKENGQERKVSSTINTPKDKRAKPMTPFQLARIPHQVNDDDKKFDKIAKKKIADIIDEAKEARGEAVRGPSKLNSRLNSLAQPKKSYVQAHHEEYQNRYGRNLLADRLQRLASAPASPTDRKPGSPTISNRARRGGGDPTAAVKKPVSSASHLDKRPKAKSPRRSASSSPSYQRAVAHAPGTIKKMVAVESYVNSHYGPRSPSPPSAAGLKCRVPLIPIDLEIASTSSRPVTEEANELGNTLHRMVDSVLSNAPAAPLSALTECEESSTKDEILPEDSISCDPSSESDYNINHFEDKDLKTAVEIVDKNTVDEDLLICHKTSNYHLQPLDSTTELKKLEHALYTQISGAFQKRLRIKNLTLTPKHSMQQVFLVQSGDVGSLLLKSTVSNIKINDTLHDMKATSVLSSSHLDWTFSQIPMQIATVGYAFPEYQASRNETRSKSKLFKVSDIASSEKSYLKASTSDKTCQCFKGCPQNVLSESGAQVNFIEEFSAHVVSVSVGSCSSHVRISEMSENIELYNELCDHLESVTKIECADNSDSKRVVVETKNEIEKETQVSNITSAPNPDSINYTASLDMLVGLLNEIQKITCQNQMTTADNTQNCAELESILNNAAVHEKTDNKTSGDLISISSLDNLRKLECNASISSYNLSSDGEGTENDLELDLDDKNGDVDGITDLQFSNNRDTVDENVMTDIYTPTSVDKEVSAIAYERETVNTSTDVLSSLMPLVVNAENLTNSMVGVSKPSVQLLLFADNQTLFSNTLFSTPSIKKIIALPQINLNEQSVSISQTKNDLDENCFKTNVPSKHSIEVVKKERNLARHELRKYCVKNVDLDPMLKTKRDILVTLYSILVLTVFVALSFPELIMLQ